MNAAHFELLPPRAGDADQSGKGDGHARAVFSRVRERTERGPRADSATAPRSAPSFTSDKVDASPNVPPVTDKGIQGGDMHHGPFGGTMGAGLAAMRMLGCSSPTACDICVTSAIAYGIVTYATGEPVAGAPVDVRVYRNSCDESLAAGGSDTGRPEEVRRTTADGFYRRVVISLFGPGDMQCVAVTVNPDSLPDLPSVRMTFEKVIALRADFEDHPPDSLRLDVVIPQQVD